jgi:peptidoglycan/LPS O-acetylase OafA/YrhL
MEVKSMTVAATRPPALATQRSHDPALDGLRGVALLMVFFLHTIILPQNSFFIFKDVLELGRLGVDLFFCLSGFLITRILFAAKNDAHYFRNFYARRALRIFPLYYFFLLTYFFLVVQWHVVNFGSSKAAEAAQDLHWLWFYGTNLRIAATGTFITSSINHFWTLAVEEHFYLIWPLLVFTLSARNLLRAVVVIAVGAFLLRVVLQWQGVPDAVILTLTPCRIDAFAIAGLVAIAQFVPEWREFLDRASSFLLLPLLVLALAAILAKGAWENTIGFSLIAISFSLLIARLRRPGRLQSLLSLPALRAVGKYSYALYVFHFPIQIALNRTIPTEKIAGFTHSLALAVVLNMVLVGVVSGITAVLTWNLIEKRFLALKKHFPESQTAQFARSGARTT